ncbi:MAG TPA: hypothetical protein PLI18_19560 [Pirellulaceae bacterium]|nr:hypothetical protein [Pirellulaceae bacterium]
MFSKVSPGAPLRISARKENAVSDLLNSLARGEQDPGVSGFLRGDSGRVLVRNETGSTLDRFTILQVSGIASDPTGNEPGFLEAPALIGTAPGVTGQRGCVVMLDPTTADPEDARLGRAMAAGTCPVKVNVISTAHRYAVPKASDTAKLESAIRGPFEILWPRPPAGTGTQWAVVRFPVTDTGLFAARPDANVASGASGTFSVYAGGADTGENVTAHWAWATDGETLEADTDCWIGWSEDENRFEVYGGSCSPS